MSAEFMSIATTLKEFEAHFVDISTAAEGIRDWLAHFAAPVVGPGAACSYFDLESAEWQDAIFHKWCEIHACPEPEALVHDRKTGKCLLVRMQDLRF